MKRKRTRLSGKGYIRLLRQRADEKAKARTESERRQERINVLRQELKKEPERIKELAKDDIRATLLELVALQRDEINFMWPDHHLCKWAKTHAPDKLASIREKYYRVVRAVLERGNKLTSKQAYERRA
jgi:hypothetical protein